jgi:Cu2+-exporting ATPase
VLSGDHTSVVRAVAEESGIDPENALARVSPEEKRAIVARMQETGNRVVMIGDGVNDAAALVQADVGIAVAGGTTASMVAADLFLTRRGLAPIAELFSSSRRVMMVIKRNLGLSLAYNMVMASLAFGGLVSPLVAAIAMPISSLAVVVSSIAQSTFRSDRQDAALA